MTNNFTFSTPKSVSIAWAIVGEETRAGVEAAQTRAVAAFLKSIPARKRRGWFVRSRSCRSGRPRGYRINGKGQTPC